MSQNSPYGIIHVRYDDIGRVEPVYEKMKRPEIIRLMITSGIIGLCVIAFNVFADCFLAILRKTPIAEHYADSYVLMYTVQIFYSVICIVLPFAIGGFIIKHFVLRNVDTLPLNRPNSGKLFVLALGICFLTLVVTNFVTSLFVLSAESFGFVFEGGMDNKPESMGEFWWQMLSTAVVPALTEEFAVRGVVLQSLRKFGDRFAICVSAVIFAVMHGNLVQAPFALVLGIVMGWLVIVTDSLWTGIAIHFMNNTYATVLTGLGSVVPETIQVVVIAIVNIVGALLGLVALLIFIDKYRHKISLYEPGGNTAKGRRAYRRKCYLYTVISLPMIAAMILMFKEIATTVHYVGV